MAGHVHELDDRGRRQHAGDEVHAVAQRGCSKSVLGLDEEVIGDQGKGCRCEDRRAATELPGDRSGKQDEDQQKGLDSRKGEGPCRHTEPGCHDGDCRKRHAVGKEPTNHSVITIRNWRTRKTRIAQYQLDDQRPAQLG